MKKVLFLSLLFLQQFLFAQAPDFAVTTNQGESFVLSETLNNGQFVLIDFLATWCGPCAEGVPEFSEIYHDFGCNQSDLVVLSISLDGSDYDTQVFHNLYQGDHPIVSGLEGGGSHVHDAYEVTSLPFYVLIDTSGVILYEGTSAATYSTLNTLLLENGIQQNGCPMLDFTQNLDFHNGWNLLSKRVLTENESMEELFADVSTDLIILKDAAGDVFWPSFNLNTIGDYDNTKGYLAKFSNDVSVNWTGILMSAEFIVPLGLGWNIIPYYATESINSTQYFNSIINNVTIVKDEVGNVYLPAFNFNNIGALQHGKAYYIKVSEAINFQY
tara:strand:- start:8054 stop:9037 length:984 start_codon:yes stop_codon:yes gene_type:complete